MAQSVYENSQDDDTRRFVPDEVYDSVEEARKAIDFLISRYDRNDGPFVYPIITHDGGKNLASIRVLEKCGFTQIYQGLGNYQGKEEKIIKTIWKN